MSLTKLSLAGNLLFPARESLVSDKTSRLGTGENHWPFLQCSLAKDSARTLAKCIAAEWGYMIKKVWDLLYNWAIIGLWLWREQKSSSHILVKKKLCRNLHLSDFLIFKCRLRDFSCGFGTSSGERFWNEYFYRLWNSMNMTSNVHNETTLFFGNIFIHKSGGWTIQWKTWISFRNLENLWRTHGCVINYNL